MSRFLLSCTTCSLRGVERDEILACFRHAPAAGYRYWGLAGPPLWDLGGARWFDAAKVARMAREAGLAGCTEVYGPQFPTDSRESAEAAAEDIALMFDLADALGSPLVVLTGGERSGPEGLAHTVAGLRRLVSLVRGHRARLALEPHMGSRLQTREDFDFVLQAVDDPKVGVTVDTGHFHTAGVDWRKLVRDYAPRILNVHLKDHVGPQSVAIGRGEVDLPALVRELHAIGYQGALAVEMEVEDPGNLPRYCAEARRYLEGLVVGVAGAGAVD